jgi:hypothetical protein
MLLSSGDKYIFGFMSIGEFHVVNKFEGSCDRYLSHYRI